MNGFILQGIDFCPGQRSPNITTQVPADHRKYPVLYNLDFDPGEKYQIKRNNPIYKKTIKRVSY